MQTNRRPKPCTPRQSSLFTRGPLIHGGKPSRGRRKSARPFSPKLPLHLVLRSTRAKGEWSFRHGRNQARVDGLVRRAATEAGIQIHKYANVGNHLHLLIETKDKASYRKFVRILSGAIAMAVTKARKSSPLRGLTTRFWDAIPFSRVVTRGRDFETTSAYIVKNLFEGEGLIRRIKSNDPRVVALWRYVPKEIRNEFLDHPCFSFS